MIDRAQIQSFLIANNLESAANDQSSLCLIEKVVGLPGLLSLFWQPIESAPKDDSAIWVGHAGPYGLWGMEPVRSRSRGEWLNIYSETVIDWHPTHWMPLPGSARFEGA